METSRNFWKLQNGIPIGSPSGPQLAIIALQDTIKEKIQILKDKGIVLEYMCYFDDHFGIATKHPKEWINKILPTKDQPKLKFEDNIEAIQIKELYNKQFDILDLNFRAIETFRGAQIHTGVFCKPMGAYQYLHWTSAHPMACKKATLSGELTRRLRLCDNNPDRDAAIKDILKKLYLRLPN
eukprot:GHVP01007526.1.p1 GENE.GHVP01007526.1~~GHVP01007526.1.p1  ORF type:complete len:182 (+),score=27.12 GHVP01007526.1:211-756(+)